MSEYYSYWHIYGSGNGTNSANRDGQFFDITFDAKLAIGTIGVVTGIIVIGALTWAIKRRKKFRDKATRRYKAVRDITGTSPSLLQPPSTSTASLHQENGLSNQAFSQITRTDKLSPESEHSRTSQSGDTVEHSVISVNVEACVPYSQDGGTQPYISQEANTPPDLDYEIVPSEDLHSEDTKHLI